jgi:type III secretory pathway component EscU
MAISVLYFYLLEFGFLLSVLTVATNFEFWQPASFILVIFSVKSLVNFILFISFTFALTGSYLLFLVFF